MPRAVINRKLELYSLHAHVNRRPPDYWSLFEALAELPAQNRALVERDRLVAIPRLQPDGDLVRLVALEGPVGLNPVVYNLERQTERVEPLQPGDVLVNRTHALIDVKVRRAIVEFNLRGAKASDIAAVLQRSGRQLPGFEGLEVALTPVIGDDFAEALDSMERIKSARVRLRRPNFDWTDWTNELTDAAAASDAQGADVEFTAGRGRSLAKKGGVIALLRDLARGRAPSPVEGATVVGRREEDAADTRITTKGFTEHRRVALRRGPDGQPLEDDAFEALMDYDQEFGKGQRSKR